MKSVDMEPRLRIAGNIKIGIKGEETTTRRGKKFRPPKRLDHFIVTLPEREDDNLQENYVQDTEIMSKLGEKPREIPILLMYEDPDENLTRFYMCYSDEGRHVCRGNGESCVRRVKAAEGDEFKEMDCPGPDTCKLAGADGFRCKLQGTLRCIINLEGIQKVGRCWRYITTSKNSMAYLLGTMRMIQAFRGRLLFTPLKLVLGQQYVTTSDGKQRRMWIVGLESDQTIQQIRAAADQPLALAAPERLEDSAIQDDEEAAEVAEEFYPPENHNGDGTEIPTDEPADPPEAMGESEDDTAKEPKPEGKGLSRAEFRCEAETIRKELGKLNGGSSFANVLQKITATALIDKVKPEQFQEAIEELRNVLEEQKSAGKEVEETEDVPF